MKTKNRSWLSNDHIFCLIEMLCSGKETSKKPSKDRVLQFLSEYQNWLRNQPPDYCYSLRQNIEFQQGILDAQTVFKQARQRLISAIHTVNKQQYQEQSTTNSIVSCETLACQLSRRFDNFSRESNHLFYTGIADYMEYVLNTQVLADICFGGIEHYKPDTSARRLSLHSTLFEKSFVALELIHHLVYSRQQFPVHFENDKYLQLYFDLCNAEFEWQINEYEEAHEQCFRRSDYNVNISRVHHTLLESLESNSSANCNKAIQYRYSQYGVPCGELLVFGHEPLIFTKNPASVLQFFFVHRESGKYYTYNNYNLYWHGKCPGLSSNSFRLLVSGINKRVRKHSHCAVTELIDKRGQEAVNEVGFYRWRNFYDLI